MTIGTSILVSIPRPSPAGSANSPGTGRKSATPPMDQPTGASNVAANALGGEFHNRGRGHEQSPGTTGASIMGDGAICPFRALRDEAALDHAPACTAPRFVRVRPFARAADRWANGAARVARPRALPAPARSNCGGDHGADHCPHSDRKAYKERSGKRMSSWAPERARRSLARRTASSVLKLWSQLNDSKRPGIQRIQGELRP